MTVCAVDPPGCGCTDCLTGQSVPLEGATGRQVAAMLSGHLADRTGADLTLKVTITATDGERAWTLPPTVTLARLALDTPA